MSGYKGGSKKSERNESLMEPMLAALKEKQRTTSELRDMFDLDKEGVRHMMLLLSYEHPIYADEDGEECAKGASKWHLLQKETV